MSGARGQHGRKITDDALRLARREAVWELRTKHGLTQMQIAEVIGMSQATVHRDLEWCHEQYRERLVDSVARVRSEQVETLEYLLAEALAAWQESKEEAMEVQRKSLQAQASSGSGSGQGQTKIKPVEQTTKVKAQTGDVSYIREARAAMSDIRKIVGADQPSKVALTDPTGEKEAAGGMVIVVPSRMTLEEAMESVEGEDDGEEESG